MSMRTLCEEISPINEVFRESVCVCVLSRFTRVQLFVTVWTVALQAPLSTGFSRQKYWSGVPCPPPADLPNPGIEPVSFTSPALAGGLLTTSATCKAPSGAHQSPVQTQRRISQGLQLQKHRKYSG